MKELLLCGLLLASSPAWADEQTSPATESHNAPYAFCCRILGSSGLLFLFLSGLRKHFPVENPAVKF